MNIAIIGVGAMGSVYAALRAEAGNEVYAVDLWQEHLNAINGMAVELGQKLGIATHYNEVPSAVIRAREAQF